MGKIFFKIIVLFLALFLGNQARCADSNNSMVQREEFLGDKLTVVGLPDFLPFSQYVKDGSRMQLHNVFWQPLQKALQKYRLKLSTPLFVSWDDCGYVPLIVGMREGKYHLFLGAYSDTKKFSGIVPIYPAVVSNPIHIIGLAEMPDKVKEIKDLQKLHGVVCDCEYFSDFAMRKINDLKVEHVATAYDAYEKLFTGKADYLIGSWYYNRIMSSQYGLERYLSASKKPLFKIPVFMSMSKLTPKLSEYIKMFQKILADPQFSTDIKNEILREVETQVQKNIGVVPPSFAPQEQDAVSKEEDETSEKVEIKGRVIEQQTQQKSIEEVLEGI